MKTVVTILYFLLSVSQNSAQPDIRLASYGKADSLAIGIEYHNDLARLSSELSTAFTNPVLKTRAIYKWISHHIAFDHRFINKEREIKWPECDNEPDCKSKQLVFEKELAQKTAARKKGTSEGYACLFKVLCLEAGINCETIKGGVRTKPYQIGNNTPFNHMWNAVYIGNAWYFVDVTLSAGITRESEETGKLLPFERKENDVYFLTPYDQFRKDHCPEKPGWQAILGISSREHFNQQPFYYDAPNYIQWISHLSPDTGMISAKVGDTIYFSFTYPITIDRIQVNTNLKRNPPVVQTATKEEKEEINIYALKKQVYWPYEKDGNRYSFKVPVTDRSLYYIDILFKYPADIDATKVLRYRVTVPWN